jgi:predicted metal-dependent hydrolase
MEIIPRDLNFDFSLAATAWLNNDICLTHMFNTPSIVLPQIECFVNFAVYHCLDHINDITFREQCFNFIKQESRHAKTHMQYNSILRNANYFCDEVVNKLKHKLQKIKKKWSLISILAVAVGFESFTMTISKIVLEENILGNSDNDINQFWRWHMMEELEHKQVLFDLYQQMGGGYVKRITIFTLVLINYFYWGLKIYFKFLNINKVSKLKGLKYIFSKNSFFLKSVIQSLKFYRYNYHPNKLNTDHLLDFNSLSRI